MTADGPFSAETPSARKRPGHPDGHTTVARRRAAHRDRAASFLSTTERTYTGGTVKQRGSTMVSIEDLYSMKGKVCVVTGGSSGIGSYMAEGIPRCRGCEGVHHREVGRHAPGQGGRTQRECAMASVLPYPATSQRWTVWPTLVGGAAPGGRLHRCAGEQRGSRYRRPVRAHARGGLGQDHGPEPEVAAVPYAGVA